MLLGGAQIWMCWTERLVLCGVSAHHLRICVSAQSDSAGLEHGLSLAFVTSLQVVPVLLVTVHGILQGRILEWVAVPFRGSSQLRD